MKKEKFTYHLGNILRGFIAGKFCTDDAAWRNLSKQIDKCYPSEGGRKVYMYKEIPVKYQFTSGTGKSK